MNESNVNLSWLGLPAPQPPADAHLEDGPRGNRATQSGVSPPLRNTIEDPRMGLLTQIRKRVRTSDYWTVPPRGSPSHRRSRLTNAVLFSHLCGGNRIGACPIERGSDTTRIALFDLDSHKAAVPWPEMQATARRLIATAAARGLQAIPVRSSGGHGIHIIFMWQAPQDARSVRHRLGQVLDECGLKNGTRGVANKQVEIFPKQDSVPADGWGSMFVLPFAGKSVALDPVTLEESDAAEVRLQTSGPVPVAEPEPVREPTSYETTPELEEVSEALSHLDPNEYDYDQWVRLLFAAHAGTGGSEEGFAVFDKWSQRFARYTREETEKQWRAARVKPDGIGVGTLFAEARKRGYVPLSQRPSIEGLTDLVGEAKAKLVGEARAADALGMADALPGMAHLVSEAAQLPEEDRVEVFDKLREVVGDEVAERFAAAVRGADAAIGRAKASAAPKVTAQALIAQFRVESREQVIATWADRAARLPRTEAEEVVAEVERLTGIKPRKLAGALNEAREAAQRARARAAFERDVAGRKIIEAEKGELGPTAAAAEAAVLARVKAGEYVVFGGRLSRVAERELPFTHLIDAEDGKPPVVPVIEQLAPTEVEVAVGKAAVFVSRGINGQRVREHVPPRVIEHLMAAPSKNVPRVSGLISHPVVMPNGEILSEDGLHARSRLFLHGARIDGLRPYTQPEAAAALARLREGLFAEFEFATDADADVAVAAVITAGQRRVMDSAPGLAVLASRQSSGKTTLARVLHLVVTGRDLPVTTLADDEAETQKRLLALLMRSPEVVCIDNVPDGFTFRSASLSAAMTSGELHQRVLGESREASVPTSVMFVITGNNLTLGADEVTRWMPCRLAPRGARPEERRFRYPDVVGHVLRQRESVLRDVVGIVAGFIAAGAPMPQAGTRFNTWDRVVRAPLIWAGASDVAEVFRRNREESADEQAQVALLLALRDLFGENEFPAVEVAKAVRVHESDRVMPGDPSARLVDALAQGRIGDIKSVKAVGRALGAVADRVVEVDGYEIVLRKRLHHGVALYHIEGGPPRVDSVDGGGAGLL